MGYQVKLKLHTFLVLVSGELAALTALPLCLLDSRLLVVVMRNLVYLFALNSLQLGLLFITSLSSILILNLRPQDIKNNICNKLL